MRRSSDPQGILRKGRATLASAGENVSLLGSALIDIHSALEHSFRERLFHDERVPEEIKTRVLSKEINWPGLITLMKGYGGLRWEDGETILRFNQIRNAIVHHGQNYQGTRQELERYAHLVESLITERNPSFDKAAMSEELYKASLAMLGVPSTTKRPPGEAVPPPAPTVQQPASTIVRSPAPPQSSRTQAPRNHSVQPGISRSSRYARREQTGNRLWLVVLMLLLIFVIWWFVSYGTGSAPLPARPTPTLGLPTGVLAPPAQLTGWVLLLLRSQQL